MSVFSNFQIERQNSFVNLNIFVEDSTIPEGQCHNEYKLKTPPIYILRTQIYAEN